jgi:hypothetical protein
VSPTLGFNIRTIVYNGYTLNICESLFAARKHTGTSQGCRRALTGSSRRGHWRPDVAPTVLAQLL